VLLCLRPEIKDLTVDANSSIPNWPAWGHDQKWAWLLDSLDPLLTVTEKYLRSGNLLTVRLIDSNLNFFKVVGIRELGRAGIFGWRPGFKEKYLRVEPILQFDRKLSLEDAKKYVVAFVSVHHGAYESGMPIEELLAVVNAADSPQTLLAAL
jgi:hypothetical protein